MVMKYYAFKSFIRDVKERDNRMLPSLQLASTTPYNFDFFLGYYYYGHLPPYLPKYLLVTYP